MATWIARLGAGFEPVREFFTQRTAERTVRAYLPGQRTLVRAHFEAADGRVRAARRLTDAPVASMLLREGLRHYLLALHWAHSAPAGGEAPTPDLLSQHLPTLAPDPLRPDVSPSDDERVRGALAATDPLFFDRLPPAEAALTRTALDRATTSLRGRLEPRSLTNVRATRWGRLAALVVCVAYVAIARIHSAAWPRNVALDKPVHASSIRGGRSPDGRELVDGEIGTSWGAATNTDDSPNFVIDLVDTFRIRSIKVYNRVDAAFDDCLPLVLELSTDGANFVEVARRAQHFGADPPWTVPGGDRLARYVRLRVARRGYLALSEVEVFGKK
jgi:hypothetical protein